VYLNVLITMFLSGLWHGAGLNFLVWGLWHGLLLVGHRAWSRWRSAFSDTLGALTGQSGRGQNPAALALVAAGTQYAGPSGLLTAAPLLSLVSGRPGNTVEMPAEVRSTLTASESRAALGAATPGAGSTEPGSSMAGKILGFALTFVLVNLGWAFFCMDLPTSWFFFRRLFFG